MAICDMFLKVESARQGPIRGESGDSRHAGEIEVLGWSWGMECEGDWYQNKASREGGRTTIHELLVTKRVDTASTGLMAALRRNDPIKKAVLSVRKASGETGLDYLTVTIERGRATSHRIVGSGSPELIEEIRFAFQKVNVEYRQQDRGGSGKGVCTFETEIDQA